MNNIEKIDEIAKDKLELAKKFNQRAEVASIYGVKAAMVEYEYYIANKLKDRIEELEQSKSDWFSYPESREDFLKMKKEVLNIIEEVRDE